MQRHCSVLEPGAGRAQADIARRLPTRGQPRPHDTPCHCGVVTSCAAGLDPRTASQRRPQGAASWQPPGSCGVLYQCSPTAKLPLTRRQLLWPSSTRQHAASKPVGYTQTHGGSRARALARARRCASKQPGAGLFKEAPVHVWCAHHPPPKPPAGCVACVVLCASSTSSAAAQSAASAPAKRESLAPGAFWGCCPLPASCALGGASPQPHCVGTTRRIAPAPWPKRTGAKARGPSKLVGTHPQGWGLPWPCGPPAAPAGPGNAHTRPAGHEARAGGAALPAKASTRHAATGRRTAEAFLLCRHTAPPAPPMPSSWPSQATAARAAGRRERAASAWRRAAPPGRSARSRRQITTRETPSWPPGTRPRPRASPRRWWSWRPCP